MGEHKRKKLAGTTPDGTVGSVWMEEMALPCDPEIFDFVAQTYHAAAHMTMPVENPAAQPVAEFDGKLISFTDTPLNRGMMAVKKQLTEIGAQHPQAYLCRLMHFGEILEQRERFGDLIKVGEGQGGLMVDSAIFYAAATARIIVTHDHMGFDIDDVVDVAKKYVVEHVATQEK